MSFLTNNAGVFLTDNSGNVFLVTDQNNFNGLPQYRLLVPHQINDEVIGQNTIVVEGFDVPPFWVPTMEVDPLNSNAVDAYYAAGPRSQPQSRVWDNNNVRMIVSQPVWIKSVTYWVQSGNFWSLAGLGSNKAPVVM